MRRWWWVIGTAGVILVVTAVALAQGGSSCPEGCTFVPTHCNPGTCVCYGYCYCPPPQGTPPPTATPVRYYDWCYRYDRLCVWSCDDLAQGKYSEYRVYVDCDTGDVIGENLLYSAPCGSCRRPRDCRVPGACTPTPVRATPTPAPTATPLPCSCPGPQKIFGTPSYQPGQAPLYPVVVGQGGSGITVRIAVTLPDWTLRQWRRKTRQVCMPGEGPFPCSLGDGSIGHFEWRDGECVSCGADDPCRGVSLCGDLCFRPFCESWDEYYPEYASGAIVQLQLRHSSIDWIQTELATRYPGARVYQPAWQAQARVVATYDTGSATTCVLEAHFPVRDPGYYDVSATIVTTERTLTYVSPDPVTAYLIDTTIIR